MLNSKPWTTMKFQAHIISNLSTVKTKLKKLTQIWAASSHYKNRKEKYLFLAKKIVLNI